MKSPLAGFGLVEHLVARAGVEGNSTGTVAQPSVITGMDPAAFNSANVSSPLRRRGRPPRAR